jgi:hypothetical protein
MVNAWKARLFDGLGLDLQRLARLAIRPRLFPIGLDRRPLGKLVVVGRKIANQDGHFRVSHCKGQRTHLRRAVAPVL